MIWNLRNFKFSSQKQVMVDAHGCIVYHLFRFGICADIYTAWVSALLIWN